MKRRRENFYGCDPNRRKRCPSCHKPIRLGLNGKNLLCVFIHNFKISHGATDHRNKEKKKIPCACCKKTFLPGSAMKRHKASHTRKDLGVPKRRDSQQETRSGQYTLCVVLLLILIRQLQQPTKIFQQYIL